MSNRFNILHAEDDESDVFIFERAMNRAQISNPVHHVDNGEKVIAYLKGEGAYADRRAFPLPKLLLLDLKMPRVSGFEVLQWVRSQPEVKLLPVIILSSSDLPKDVERAYDIGANAYLIKTADPDKMSILLKNIYLFWHDSAVLPE